MELREYQTRTILAIRQAAAQGNRHILGVMPTGAGKTAVMGEIAGSCVAKGNKVLALMHRRGLVEQMTERFADTGLQTGYIMAGKESSLDSQCQIASLWTYARRTMLGEHWLVDAPVILIDEAHHVLCKTYQKVLKSYPNAFVIGCTATPTLSTGAGLGKYFDSMVNVVSMDELISGGFLVPGVYYGPSEPDLSKLRIVQGDYEKKALDEKFNKPQIVGDVVDNWLSLAGNLKTMVFGINRRHSKALCQEFLNRGVSAEYLDAHNDDDERSAVIGRLESGRTQVVCQVALYTEGTDIPQLQCLVVARPTRSLGLHRQILGRGARPFPGKDSFLVLDHGGNCKRLGYYEDEIAWTLEDKPYANKEAKPRKKERRILTCEMCGCLHTGPRCPRCGHTIKDFGKKIEAVEAELVPLKKEKTYTTADKRRWYQMLEYERRRLGKTEKWLLAQYRSKFGVWPRSMDELGHVEPDDTVRNWLKYQRIKWIKSKQRQEVAA